MPNLTIAAVILIGVQSASSTPNALPSIGQTPSAETSLHLVCDGTGVDTRVGAANAYAYGSGGWGNVTSYARKSKDFDDELEIEISGSGGRARLPRRIVPKLHGGENGWFEIKKLLVGNDQITGKIALNFTNAPYLRIDRISGAVSVDGRDGSFSGRCRSYSPHDTHAF